MSIRIDPYGQWLVNENMHGSSVPEDEVAISVLDTWLLPQWGSLDDPLIHVPTEEVETFPMYISEALWA